LNRYCSNEEDYHQRVIQHMASFPDELKSRVGLYAFVWGHEVDMHDAGRNGGNGCADLMTTDEEGMVWLVEAKFDATFEKGAFVWGSQLLRYKDAIARMSWQEVLSYVAKFLRGREKTKPKISFPISVEKFTTILEIWQSNIGRSLVEPQALNDRIATHLKRGTYGIMVLTDFYDESYAAYGNDFQHAGPLAYVRGVPTDSGIDFQVQWYRPGADEYEITPFINMETSNLDPPKFSCNPSTFGDSLCEGSRDLWLNLLRPGLVELGWNERTANGGMGFDVNFMIGNKSVPLLIIGWPERHAKNTLREHKLAGTAGMRINPHIKRIYRASNFDAALANKWMKRFYDRGWRGREAEGMRERWGVIPIVDLELRSKVQGIMQYEPRSDIRDHTGRPGDRQTIEGLLADYAEMLGELRAGAASGFHHDVSLEIVQPLTLQLMATAEGESVVIDVDEAASSGGKSNPETATSADGTLAKTVRVFFKGAYMDSMERYVVVKPAPKGCRGAQLWFDTKPEQGTPLYKKTKRVDGIEVAGRERLFINRGIPRETLDKLIVKPQCESKS